MDQPARRSAMYHFTFIDEASTVTDKKEIEKQESILDQKTNKSNKSTNLLTRTVNFLHQYIDQNNSIRIFTNKD